LECTDAIRIINSRDSANSFFYCDPPYFNSNCGHYDGYSKEDFEGLLKTLSKIEGQFVLSSYPSELLKEFTEINNWKSKVIEQQVSVNKGYGKNKVEVLTWNGNKLKEEPGYESFGNKSQNNATLWNCL
jgi:DNA adenine methylase